MRLRRPGKGRTRRLFLVQAREVRGAPDGYELVHREPLGMPFEVVEHPGGLAGTVEATPQEGEAEHPPEDTSTGKTLTGTTKDRPPPLVDDEKPPF